MRSVFYRRTLPRLPTFGLCGVVGRDQKLRHATMLNISGSGLRLERPFDPASASPFVELEIELPRVDEILWARARVISAHLSPMGGAHPSGRPKLWCSAGLELEGMSRAEERRLLGYVCDALRERAIARMAA